MLDIGTVVYMQMWNSVPTLVWSEAWNLHKLVLGPGATEQSRPLNILRSLVGY
jgi:hypothetical protein